MVLITLLIDRPGGPVEQPRTLSHRQLLELIIILARVVFSLGKNLTLMY